MARRKKKTVPEKIKTPKLVSSSVQIKLMKKIAKEVKGGIGTMDDMLPDTIYPSIFTSLNRMLGRGGIPSRRIYMIHGENSTGKSVLALAIGETMRRYGFVVKVDDTEFAAERRWYKILVEALGFLFEMPESMDLAMRHAQELFNAMHADRAKKKYAVNQGPGLVLIEDTFTQLVSESAMKKVREGGVKKGYSEAAQWRDWWFKSFVPQTFINNSIQVLVTQLRDNMNKGSPFAPDKLPTGGNAMQFGNSIRFSVNGAGQVKEGTRVVGQRSYYSVEKNKADGTSKQKGSFFTSNGRGGAPSGFDLVREAMEEATYRKQVKVRAKTDGRPSGNVIEVGDFCEFFPGGLANIRAELSDNEEMFGSFTDALNADAERASYECAPPPPKKKK